MAFAPLAQRDDDEKQVAPFPGQDIPPASAAVRGRSGFQYAPLGQVALPCRQHSPGGAEPRLSGRPSRRDVSRSRVDILQLNILINKSIE